MSCNSERLKGIGLQTKLGYNTMKIAFLFPGQGSQVVGMGKELYDNFACARQLFEKVDAALGENLSKLIFEGPEDALTLTTNAQPALMAVSVAASLVLEELSGRSICSLAQVCAGHSLGEYSALAAMGALPVDTTARLLRKRGAAMQQAVRAEEGAMAAILGLGMDEVETVVAKACEGVEVCKGTGVCEGKEVCEVANDNAPGQIVISGHKPTVLRAAELAKSSGAKRALLLPVSAPFHCSLMQPAAEVMAQELAACTWPEKLPMPLVANVLAQSYDKGACSAALLCEQVTGRVRWRESMLWLADQGYTHVIELGAGKVLAGLMKRTCKSVIATSAGTPGELEILAKQLGEEGNV